MTRPGEPEELAHPDYCWIHLVVERQGRIRCGECLHWFADEQALVADYNAGLADISQRYGEPYVPRTINEIHFCPHCAHDF